MVPWASPAYHHRFARTFDKIRYMIAWNVLCSWPFFVRLIFPKSKKEVVKRCVTLNPQFYVPIDILKHVYGVVIRLVKNNYVCCTLLDGFGNTFPIFYLTTPTADYWYNELRIILSMQILWSWLRLRHTISPPRLPVTSAI